MSKERLEEIRNRMIVEKHHFKYLNSEKGYWENVYTLLEQDMKYLFDTIIKQAERVHELEKRLKIYQKRSWFEDYEKVAKQNKRYREALEKIRKEETVTTALSKGQVAYTISGLIANEALEGESDA